MKNRALSFVALLGLCALAASAIWVTPSRPPNVVLITVDTLRADALSPYGQRATATPAALRLAREGLLFENAFCPMPQTRPSHASILTSKHPRDHGVLNNVTPLGMDALTLTEVLKADGYQTGGFVSVRLLDGSSGAAQGFEVFSAPEGEVARTAADTVPRALQYLEQAGNAGRPFFLWLHLFDPHMPYTPPEGFRLPSGDGSPRLAEFSWPFLRELARRRGGELSAEVLAEGRRLYQGEVSFQDFWLGKLLEQLDRLGLTERTLVVLTADHGECFDHGVFFDHTDCLYDGALRVPLIFRLPGRLPSGARDTRLVENVDIAPSILDLLGLRVAPGFQGHSLFRGGQRAAVYFERPLYQEEAAKNRPQRAEAIRVVAGESVRSVNPEQDWVGIRTEAWKLLELGTEEELYRVDQDPEERHDLRGGAQATAEGLRRDLQAWRARHPLRLGKATRVNEDLREVLRSLGYVQ